ncbi:unnamed protein product, partial [Nesidiocoris tenuis]
MTILAISRIKLTDKPTCTTRCTSKIRKPSPTNAASQTARNTVTKITKTTCKPGNPSLQNIKKTNSVQKPGGPNRNAKKL